MHLIRVHFLLFKHKNHINYVSKTKGVNNITPQKKGGNNMKETKKGYTLSVNKDNSVERKNVSVEKFMDMYRRNEFIIPKNQRECRYTSKHKVIFFVSMIYGIFANIPKEEKIMVVCDDSSISKKYYVIDGQHRLEYIKDIFAGKVKITRKNVESIHDQDQLKEVMLKLLKDMEDSGYDVDKGITINDFSEETIEALKTDNKIRLEIIHTSDESVKRILFYLTNTCVKMTTNDTQNNSFVGIPIYDEIKKIISADPNKDEYPSYLKDSHKYAINTLKTYYRKNTLYSLFYRCLYVSNIDMPQAQYFGTGSLWNYNCSQNVLNTKIINLCNKKAPKKTEARDLITKALENIYEALKIVVATDKKGNETGIICEGQNMILAMMFALNVMKINSKLKDEFIEICRSKDDKGKEIYKNALLKKGKPFHKIICTTYANGKYAYKVYNEIIKEALPEVKELLNECEKEIKEEELR